MNINEPFANFKDFADCVSKNQDKENPEGYCATIKQKTEGGVFNLNWNTKISPLIIRETSSGMNWMEIQGDAIHETTTRNNYIYTADELEKASKTLENKPILKDHEAKIDNIVGKVTHAWFDKESRSVKFRGKIMDEDIKQKINDSRISAVSIGASVQDLIEEQESSGKYKVKGLEFLELSLVAIPGDPDASIGAKFEKIVESSKQTYHKDNSYIPSITNSTETITVTVPSTSTTTMVESVGKSITEEKKMESEEIQKLKEENKLLKEKLESQISEKLTILEQQIKELTEKAEAKGKVIIESEIEEQVEQIGRFTVIKDSKGYFVMEKDRDGANLFRIKSLDDLKGLN